MDNPISKKKKKISWKKMKDRKLARIICGLWTDGMQNPVTPCFSEWLSLDAEPNHIPKPKSILCVKTSHFFSVSRRPLVAASQSVWRVEHNCYLIELPLLLSWPQQTWHQHRAVSNNGTWRAWGQQAPAQIRQEQKCCIRDSALGHPLKTSLLTSR